MEMISGSFPTVCDSDWKPKNLDCNNVFSFWVTFFLEKSPVERDTRILLGIGTVGQLGQRFS